MDKRPDIAWRDLVPMRRRDTLRELALPLPWLAAALLAAAQGWTWPAVAATFVLFMTGLRVTHGAFHRALGLRGRGNDAVMFVLSVLLGGAMHAIECTHRHHHRACLDADDVEGRIAHLGVWRALLHSPLYPFHIHAFALRHGSRRQRGWVRAELAAVVALQVLVWGVFDNAALQTITLALLFANASAAMVGIWAVHRACDAAGFNARSSRSRVLDACVAGMFHHLEHHLYPAVPTRRLAVLAQRFDAARRDPIRTVAGGLVRPARQTL